MHTPQLLEGRWRESLDFVHSELDNLEIRCTEKFFRQIMQIIFQQVQQSQILETVQKILRKCRQLVVGQCQFLDPVESTDALLGQGEAEIFVRTKIQYLDIVGEQLPSYTVQSVALRDAALAEVKGLDALDGIRGAEMKLRPVRRIGTAQYNVLVRSDGNRENGIATGRADDLVYSLGSLLTGKAAWSLRTFERSAHQ